LKQCADIFPFHLVIHNNLDNPIAGLAQDLESPEANVEWRGEQGAVILDEREEEGEEEDTVEGENACVIQNSGRGFDRGRAAV